MFSWTRPLAGLAAVALLVAACGGAASPTPAGGSAAPAAATAPATDAPAATEAPATEAPAAASATTGGAPDVTGAAAALANLESYYLSVAMNMSGLEESVFSMFGDGLDMSGTVIRKPTQAADISIKMGTADQKLDMGYRVLGDQAWVRLGESWMETPAEDARTTIDSLAPEKLMGSFSGISGLTPVGDETKNGIETTRYSASSADIGNAMGSAIGLPNATWAMDMWVAKDGGYAVAYALTGKGDTGSFEMAVDISKINDPSNTVEAPTGG